MGGREPVRYRCTDFSSLAHKPAIRRGPDSHGEQPAITEPSANFPEKFDFVADGAVGNEYHLAQSLVCLRHRQWERQFQRRTHFGSTTGIEVPNEFPGFRKVVLRGRHWLAKQAPRRGIERHDIEAVCTA